MTCTFLSVFCTCFRNVSIFSILVYMFSLTSCTITMINSSVEGGAQDVIDAIPTSTTDIDPAFHLPALG